jgi:putative glutamine amidotransferase
MKITFYAEVYMPYIGICADWDSKKGRSNVPNGYVKAVIKAGGVPIILPLVDDENAWTKMINLVDGVIFTGGVDIEASRFGQETHPKADEPVLLRDKQEYAMLEHVKKTRKPTLCICRGIQLLNCFEGGDLYQDIDDLYKTDINHALFDNADGDVHKVSVEADSKFYNIVKEKEFYVNSRHHQAIDRLAESLKVSAYSPDGIIEAVEYKEDLPIIGVQWHPESMFEKYEVHLRPFEWLIKQCG